MKLEYLRGVATLELASDKCKGCGRCLEVCPHGVFRLSGGRAEIVDRDACMECGACARNCAFRAVTVRSGVGCAHALISGKLRGTEPSCGCSSGCGCS